MKYYVDFCGYCEIEANSPEEANEKFWDGIQSCTTDEYVFCEIDSIEPVKEED